VVSEIEHLVALGATGIPIQDDLFIANHKRFVDIVEKLKQKSLDKKFRSSINIRANLVTDELCEMLKVFPTQEVHFGAESASDRILTLMGKGVTANQNQIALDKLYKAGIKACCSFIVGWPTETEDELRATYRFMLDNVKAGKLDVFSTMNILTPFPGTAVWNDAVNDGTIDLNTFDWGRLGIFASYRTSNMPNFDSWANIRRQNNSIYLNERTLPQERLYKIMGEYEDIIGRR
jgi:radical SAM superfamily enzyme YgiQ (UPF0313 family)